MTLYTCGFSHVYLQSVLLHDIRALFCHVYLRSFLQTRIYMRTKKPVYMRYKQECGIWGQRNSSNKRYRIIPSAKNPFMYDGADKKLQFESSMAAMAGKISRTNSKLIPSFLLIVNWYLRDILCKLNENELDNHENHNCTKEREAGGRLLKCENTKQETWNL